MPDGAVELVIGLGTAPLTVYSGGDLSQRIQFTGGLISGSHSQSFAINSNYDGDIIGVHFKPGGAVALLGMPATELHNQQVALYDVWGSFSAELHHRLLSAHTTTQRFHILESTLLSRINHDKQHPAVGYALGRLNSAESPHPIATLADAIGLSQRHFISLFRDQVGMTPKKYSRVQRFQRVIRQLDGMSDYPWSDIALSCGYFDQSHFIHDFRRFSGFTPSIYAARKSGRVNHVPIL